MDEDSVLAGQSVQVIDPDVRAYVYSLVTALGGFNGADVDQYVLGDDALSCLRDIKRWLKLYDEKNNRMDVARCLGEANLVSGDLLPILSLYGASGQTSKYLARIALACLELLVPLTWPIEIHSQMTANHHRHTPYIQQVQVQYKRGILSYANSSLLRTVIRISLPSMAVPRSERSTRDEGILKIMLYLIRNVAIISPGTSTVAEGDEEATSRSATINAFQAQDVFALVLTMCSNVSDDFNAQDVILLEILFHIVRGVDVEKLFMDDAQRKARRIDDLGRALEKELSLQREYARNAPTRHGRFGTMIWVKRDDEKFSAVSGQDVLKGGQAMLQKMDDSKKWNRPQRHRKLEDTVVNNDFCSPVSLSITASMNLRKFVEEFLDSGFNIVFPHVRKAIEREADRVLDINSRQFFYTVAWFLEAERLRRARQLRHSTENGMRDIEPDSFGLVAGVLNQETFVFLNRSMQYSYDHKDWEDLNAEMLCFTQILLTVQAMAVSPIEDDKEIAENIQNRIFYEETTHDRILSILRGYKDQGFGYLDACTELAHVFLRMLEQYSKENVDMQVRSRRRRRKGKSARPAEGGDEADHEHKSEDEDRLEAERTSKERKFDFKRVTNKFCNQNCVDTFIMFTRFYRELDHEQLKRAHRYFYRIAFKQDMSVLLFRVDIINLFFRMVKGPGGMDPSNPIFKEWDELVRQIIRRLVKKLDQRPALVTEMLFSKISSTVFYLEYGYEKQIQTRVKRQRAELIVDPRAVATTEAKLEIVVAAMAKDEDIALVKWVSEVLRSAADERESWEANEEIQRAELADVSNTFSSIIPVKPQDESCEKQMFSNGKLRLLMTLAGFERLGTDSVPDASWIIPSATESKDLRNTKLIIDRCLERPAVGHDEQDPRDLLRRVGNDEAREKGLLAADIDFGSGSEGEYDIQDGLLFPPNLRSKSSSSRGLKVNQKKNKQNETRELLDDETLENRRNTREKNALARQAKIKSSLYIHASDEESDAEADAEFFRLEEQRRKAQSERIQNALQLRSMEDGHGASGHRKRKNTANSSAAERKRPRRSLSVESGEEDATLARSESPRRQRRESSSPDEEETPLTAEDNLSLGDRLVLDPDQTKATRPEIPDQTHGAEAERKESATARRRIRGGFVIDSDSE